MQSRRANAKAAIARRFLFCLPFGLSRGMKGGIEIEVGKQPRKVPVYPGGRHESGFGRMLERGVPFPTARPSGRR